MATPATIRLVTIWAALGYLVSGCLVDGGHPCGSERTLGPRDGCICQEGRVESPDGLHCVAAPPTALDAGLTQTATQSDPGPIGDAGLPEDDASAGPTGLAEPCNSSADCVGFDARYCETFQSHVCLISDCSQAPDSCPSGWSCCDLTSFGMPTLCVTSGTCPL